MPRIVDHDQRRLQVAAVVEQLVLENGIEALTIRDVARRAGCSTSVVSHYFASKLDLLVFTHRTVRHRAEQRLIEALEADLPLAECLERLLPMTDAAWCEWHTWFAFWGMAPAQPAVNAEWQTGSSYATDLFIRLIRAAQRRGEIAAGVDAATGAIRLQLSINGIASLVLQERSAWPADRQKALLREMIAATLGDGQTTGEAA